MSTAPENTTMTTPNIETAHQTAAAEKIAAVIGRPIIVTGYWCTSNGIQWFTTAGNAPSVGIYRGMAVAGFDGQAGVGLRKKLTAEGFRQIVINRIAREWCADLDVPAPAPQVSDFNTAAKRRGLRS